MEDRSGDSEWAAACSFFELRLRANVIAVICVAVAGGAGSGNIAAGEIIDPATPRDHEEAAVEDGFAAGDLGAMINVWNKGGRVRPGKVVAERIRRGSQTSRTAPQRRRTTRGPECS